MRFAHLKTHHRFDGCDYAVSPERATTQQAKPARWKSVV
jgi:hypothetical protein